MHNAEDELAGGGDLAARGTGPARQHDDAEAVYVLPWERPPSWLYLPHLLVDGNASGGGAGSGSGHAQPASASRGSPATMGDHVGLHGIQGRGNSPGSPRVARERHGESIPRSAERAIRGPDHGPGPEHGAARVRAQTRLAARNAHLQISLADHAERVSRRREREPSGVNQPTPADRMAALRRRVTDRAAEARGAAASATGAAQRGEGRRDGGGADRNEPCDGAAGPGEIACRARAKPSKEDVKIHQTLGMDGAAEQCEARGRTSPANADMAAAACFTAWHDDASGGPAGRVG